MATSKKTTTPTKGPEVPREMLGMPERLARAMKTRQVNQVRLGQLAGVSQSSISKLANSDSLSGVTAVVVARVCLGLKIPPGWLLLGEGDVVPDLTAVGQKPLVVDEEDKPLVPDLSRGRSDAGPRARRSAQKRTR